MSFGNRRFGTEKPTLACAACGATDLRILDAAVYPCDCDGEPGMYGEYYGQCRQCGHTDWRHANRRSSMRLLDWLWPRPTRLEAVMTREDREREAAIRHHRDKAITEEAIASCGGIPANHAAQRARLHWTRMKELIRGRRREVVEAMEYDRGLR